jgi:hypothetical protein
MPNANFLQKLDEIFHRFVKYICAIRCNLALAMDKAKNIVYDEKDQERK